MHHTSQSISKFFIALILVAVASANSAPIQAVPRPVLPPSSPVAVAVSSETASSAKVTPGNSTLKLQLSVAQLNTWLSGSPDAEGWRRFLLLNILETQTALGERADLDTLALLENRFSQTTPGLSHPAFKTVHLALEQQIKVLGNSRRFELKAAMDLAKQQFQPISIEAITRQCEMAKYELELLKKYYRKTMSSRPRAKLFLNLELEAAIDFLGGLEFTLAPEVSVGKVDSKIRDIQKTLNKIVEQIDAMPAVPDAESPKAEVPEGEKNPTESVQDNEGATDKSQKSLAELQDDRAAAQKQLDALKKQRSEIRKQDKPRRDERSRVFRRLRQLENNFIEAGKTQTDPYFFSTSTTLEQFVRLYYYGTADNLQEDYLRRLADLETNLQQIDGPEARKITGIVGDSLHWFDDTNQATGLVVGIRANYSLPNLYVSVSGDLLNQLAGQSLSQSQAVRENFGGRLVRGNSTVIGKVDVELQDDPNQVHASIHLSADMSLSTYIQQGKLQVYTGAAGPLEARRSIFANLGGLFAGKPIVAANIWAYFNGTSSRLGLINRIAEKKFNEAKAEGEGTTARKAELQIKDQFLTQTDEAVSSGQEALTKVQKRLTENANLAPQLFMRSTASHIELVGKKSSLSTLAAPDSPKPSGIPTDIGVRVHETMLSNFLSRNFSGKTFTDAELAKEIGDLVGGEPAALTGEQQQDGEDNSFSITFATIRPIQFEFQNNGFGVSISGRRFSQGDKKIDTGLRIGLRFKITRVDGQLKLVRDGKAEIEYVGDKNAKAVAFRSFLDGRLNPKDGGEQISADLPDNLLPLDQVEALKDSEIANQLRLVQIRAEQGWLYVGWNHLDGDELWEIDTPAIWNTDSTGEEKNPNTAPVQK